MEATQDVDRTSEALDRIARALRGLCYGTVTAVVQDGVVVQVNGRRRSESTGARPGPDDDRRPSRPARADPSTGRPCRQHARRSPGRPEARPCREGNHDHVGLSSI